MNNLFGKVKVRVLFNKYNIRYRCFFSMLVCFLSITVLCQREVLFKVSLVQKDTDPCAVFDSSDVL